MAERGGAPAAPGAAPLAFRVGGLCSEVTQYRKDHGLTPSTRGSGLAVVVAEMGERVEALVSAFHSRLIRAL